MNKDLHDVAIALGNHIDRLMAANNCGGPERMTAEIKSLATTRDDLCRIVAPQLATMKRRARVRSLTDQINGFMCDAEAADMPTLAAELGSIRWGEIQDFANSNPSNDEEKVAARDALQFIVRQIGDRVNISDLFIVR